MGCGASAVVGTTELDLAGKIIDGYAGVRRALSRPFELNAAACIELRSAWHVDD